jgi:hypothetical protein
VVSRHHGVTPAQSRNCRDLEPIRAVTCDGTSANNALLLVMMQPSSRAASI